MKKSRIVMSAMLVLAVSAAFAFKPASSKALFTARYQISSGLCQPVTNNLCDGAPPHAVCSNVYVSIDENNQCIGQTFKTLP